MKLPALIQEETKLIQLAEAMASDARFIDVRWFASEEVLSGIPGALRPIEP
jgi:hypothetical protein